MLERGKSINVIQDEPLLSGGQGKLLLEGISDEPLFLLLLLLRILTTSDTTNFAIGVQTFSTTG